MEEIKSKKFKIVFWPLDTYHSIPEEFIGKTREIVQRSLTDRYLLEKLKINIIVDGDPQRLGEEEYDARIEYSLKILDEKSNEMLMHMINYFMIFLQHETEEEQHKFTCAMVLSTKEFFDVDFNSASSEIPTQFCSFANLIDRSQPINHRRVRINEDPHGIMNRFYNKTVECPMLTDFEHDRRQMILRFPFMDKQRKEDGIVEDVYYVVSLTVRYRQIKRVMARLIHDNKKEQFNLELFFHLSSPVVIRRIKLFMNQNQPRPEGMGMLNRQGDRYTAWDLRDRYLGEEVNESPIFTIMLSDLNTEEYCQLINRLGMSTERFIEFRTFTKEVQLPFRAYKESPVDNETCRKVCGDNFKLLYMIAALLSRGAVVKDYIMASEASRDQFVQKCARDFRKDRALTLEVMEQLLAEIDKRLDSVQTLTLYKWIHHRLSKNVEVMKQIHDDIDREGYVRVRKVLITPTRMLFVAPELLMGNRVLRHDIDKFPLEKYLRVVFRDDDGTQVHAVNMGQMLIERFIGKKLRDGITVAGRKFNYFGSSNSQMRDNGCYFIAASFQEIEEIRKQLGSFKIQSAPKMMSRIAQCFTQARETGLELERKHYGTVHDYVGGKDSKDEPYTFSDGVGRISMETARELSRELKLDNCIPSCFQIRFRGYKGILVVDKSLDRLREWGQLNGVIDATNWEKRDCWLDLHIQFRPSQKKFKAPRANQKLEIVKYSSPVPISLNRPVNNILDQVSACQSKESHQRICNRIHQLMDIHLHMLTRSLIDETKARNRLGEFPKVILYDQVTDINLTKEPFYRSMIRASVRATLKKLRIKLQIPIPTSLGRAMFGVIDESGQLQYGQVFIRYTKNAALKLPGPTAEKNVLKGPVMITKNPSIVAGDIRMFNAVDIPALHHLCDVVVFPRYGPRPHTDEMAGSDLDGDEYTIIWDEQLYLDRNEEAFDYTCKAQEAAAINEDDLREKMAEFFVDYIKQDSIGRIANAFLVNSDLYGIKSEVCMRIAAKHMEAVDFPKTGKPPKPLRRDWDIPKDDNGEPIGEPVPPERAERSPDFMEKNNEPCYISTRLNGQLFRRAKEIDDILTIATQDEEVATVELDPLITWPGCDSKELLELAQKHYDSYSANIQSILDCYGIRTEGELFSGHFASLRNRLSDKDSDDMSFYNTTNAIEQQLFSVFGRFRRQFFETSLCGQQRRYEEVTVAMGRFARVGNAKDVFRRMCTDPADDYKKLACAYYLIAYDSKTRRLLSFPWLAWDVINVVRRMNSVKSLDQDRRFTFDPLSDKITDHIEEYISHRNKHFNQFKKYIVNPGKAPNDEKFAYSMLKRYCERHKGLDKLMFYCTKWAKMWTLINDEEGRGTLNQLHICILLIQFGLNYLPCEAIESQPQWLEQISLNNTLQQNSSINLERQHGSLGKKFLLFLEFLASRQFQLLKFVDFSEADIGYQSVLDQSLLERVHKCAIQVYHQVAFTFRLESLPSTADQRNRTGVPTQQTIEGEPFVVEVPSSRQDQVIHNQELLNKLCEYTGCTNIVFRDLPKNKADQKTVRLYVSSTGTMQSLNKLRELLAVTAPLNLSGDCRQIFTQMAEQLYDRLINL